MTLLYFCSMKSRVKAHNREVVTSAEYRAAQMRYNPSPLEEKMLFFLRKNNVIYESQRIFYIYDNDGWINKYYIADFYIPNRAVIIEVDGKFHDKHRQHDNLRTRKIQQQYPNVRVLRYKWADLEDTVKMNELLSCIR